MPIAQCHVEVVREQRLNRTQHMFEYWLSQILSIDPAMPSKEQGKLRLFYVTSAAEAFNSLRRIEQT